jgi:hypothetical protein
MGVRVMGGMKGKRVLERGLFKGDSYEKPGFQIGPR